jgi:S1-C subfamily serine protease
VRAASDLFAAVASLEPGKSAPVVVQRGKQQLTLAVEVGNRSREARSR